MGLFSKEECNLCGEKAGFLCRKRLVNKSGYICKECEKKFNSYKKEKEELYSSIKKEFDNKYNKKEKELQEKYGIKFIKNTTENHKNYF